MINVLASTKSKRQAERVVLLILDSFSPHYLAMYDLPNLRYLKNQGVWYARAKGVFPSTTTANHTSILTGAYPNKTGIPNNSRYDREFDQIRSPLRDIQVPTLPEILAKHNLVTVELAHFLLENRQAISYPTHGPKQFIQALETHDPDLLIYLDMDVDTQGHRLGPYKMQQTLEKADSDLGEILAYLKAQNKLDQTAFLVASDHGMIESLLPETAPSLLTDIKKAGFSLATSNRQIKQSTDLVAIRAGSVFLYIREGRLSDKRYDELLTLLYSIPNTDIFTATELQELNVDPYAVGDLVIAPKPGYVLQQGTGGGLHGVPETQHTTLFLSGAGIRKGLIKGQANTVDIAPTILQLLGLAIPEQIDGVPLTGALESSSPNWKKIFNV